MPHIITNGSAFLGFRSEDDLNRFLNMDSRQPDVWKKTRNLPLNSAGDGWWAPIENFQMRGAGYDAAINGGLMWSILDEA